ncbi:MAG: DUF4340 domain-containing protein [Planctomycetota bacterium]
MNEKTVKTLGIATAVAIVGTILFNSLRDRSTAASASDERLLPELEDRVNDVRSVVVESSSGTMTFVSEGDGWTMAEKGGFPVRSEKVRELVLAFRDARKFEEKTSDPAKFDRLGLIEPDAEDSRSTRLTLKDGSGATISEVLVGNRRPGKAFGAQLPEGLSPDDQYYVRPGNEGPSWLALGDLGVDAPLSAWVDQQFLNVARDRIKAVRIAHPDGDAIAAVREEMDANEMLVLDVPEGMQPKTPNGTGQLLNALTGLRFDDVKKAADLDWSSNPITTAEYFTEHGLRVVVETMELPSADDPEQMIVWARVRTDVAPDDAPTAPEPEPMVGPLPPEEDASDDAEAADGDLADATTGAEDEAPSLDELRTESEELAAGVADWAYAIPSWKTNVFRMRSETLLEPVPEPEPELADDGTADDGESQDESAPDEAGGDGDSTNGDG